MRSLAVPMCTTHHYDNCPVCFPVETGECGNRARARSILADGALDAEATLFWTNADKAYDYHYVSTLATVAAEGLRATWPGHPTKPLRWRLVVVSDLMRFARFQTPRYASGGCQAMRPGSEGADYMGLPTTTTALLAVMQD